MIFFHEEQEINAQQNARDATEMLSSTVQLKWKKSQESFTNSAEVEAVYEVDYKHA